MCKKIKIFFTDGTIRYENFKHNDLFTIRKYIEYFSMAPTVERIEICTEDVEESEQETAEETDVAFSSDAVDAISQDKPDIF